MPKIILEIEVDELTHETLQQHIDGKLMASFKIEGQIVEYPIMKALGTCGMCDSRNDFCDTTWLADDQYCDLWEIGYHGE